MEETLTAQQRAAQRITAEHGVRYWSEIGKKGGQTTLQRHGKAHYQASGKKGGARMRELLERGKAIEAEREK
jgi:uncharacterized protein